MSTERFRNEELGCVRYVELFVSGVRFDPHALERALGEPGGEIQLAGVSPPTRRRNVWFWRTRDWRGALDLEEHLSLVTTRFAGAEPLLRDAPGAETRDLVVFLDMPEIVRREEFRALSFPRAALAFALAADLRVEIWPSWRSPNDRS